LPGGREPRPPPRPRPPGPERPDRPRGCAPPRRRGDAAVRRAPPHPLTLRVHPGQGGEWPPAGRPGGGTEATRTRHPRPLHPLSGRPAAHDPPPPAHSPAVAAGLNPHPVGRRTRVGRPTPALPAPLLPA